MELVEGRADIADLDAFLEAIDGIGANTESRIQVFDARYVVDRTHLERAVELATRAQERDEMIARELAVEILLYAAGRRQIQDALTMGVSEGSCPVVAVVVGGDEASARERLAERLDPESTLGAPDEDRLMDFFDITEGELGVTGDLAPLVHERVAMLVVNR
jgi:KEOPS complex subunit Cgi121